jgi:hypothetical protein
VKALQQFEDILENLVEGAVVEATAGHIHPVEIAKKLARAMENGQTVSAAGLLVPNDYAVRLSSEDYASFAPFRGSLEHELASYLRALAQERNAGFLTPPRVTLVEDAQVRTRRIHVSARLADLAPAPLENRAVQVTARVPVAEVRAALQRSARLVLADKRTIVLEGNIIAAGRNLDNDLVIEDRRVSRHHVQIRLMHDSYYLLDLESANGTLVNGERIDQVVLRDGDRISLGGFEMVFHVGPRETGRGE